MFNELEDYVASGMSIRDITVVTGKSYSSVRYHLKKHGVKTQYTSKSGNSCECMYCGRLFVYDRKSGHRWEICNTCGVAKRAKEMKQKLVDHLGGKCVKCGFSKTLEALQFHHVDSREKDFQISGNYNRSFESLLTEVKKCILLCSNCHIEEHSHIDRFLGC